MSKLRVRTERAENRTMPLELQALGQAGFRIRLGTSVLYLDPYLSDQVERVEGPHLKRLRPAPLQAADIGDADYVLVSHAHIDHCDIDTLLPLSKASPNARFVGPRCVTLFLQQHGIAQERMLIANRSPILFGDSIKLVPIPAAHKHIEEDADGFLRYLGYVIEWQGMRILHTGDTCAHHSLIDAVRACGPIDIALLPVNECNYFRDRAGIVGNMSIREAFQLAEEVNAATVVPMHYDMFAPNRAYREEIEIIYQKTAPRFRLELDCEKL